MSTTTTTASDSGGGERAPGKRQKIILSAADPAAAIQKMTAEFQAACDAGDFNRAKELSTQLAQMTVAAAEENGQLKARLPRQMPLDVIQIVKERMQILFSPSGTKPGKPECWISKGGESGSLVKVKRLNLAQHVQEIELLFSQRAPHALSGEVVPARPEIAAAERKQAEDDVRSGRATHAESNALGATEGPTMGMADIETWKPQNEGMMTKKDLPGRGRRGAAGGGGSSSSSGALNMRCVAPFMKPKEGGGMIASMTGAVIAASNLTISGGALWNTRSFDLQSSYNVAEGDTKHATGVTGPDPKLNAEINKRNAKRHLNRELYDLDIVILRVCGNSNKCLLFDVFEDEKKEGREMEAAVIDEPFYQSVTGSSSRRS